MGGGEMSSGTCGPKSGMMRAMLATALALSHPGLAQDVKGHVDQAAQRCQAGHKAGDPDACALLQEIQRNGL